MKSHKTVTLTMTYLCYHYACDEGCNAARPLLPAKVSTDPLDNLALAGALIEGGTNHYRAFTFARWLGEMEYLDFVSVPVVTDSEYVVAQLLAFWADAVLVKQGK